MSKVAIIAPSSRAYMPYLTAYLDVLESRGESYDLYYWDRYHMHDDDLSGNRFICNAPANGIKSLVGYLQYRKFLLGKLRTNSYRCHIVISTQVGILVRRYLKDKKYLLDIRDFSHENNLLYRILADRLVRRATTTVISSAGFRDWLPSGIDYLLTHNAARNSFEAETRAPVMKADRLVVSYIGGVSYYDANLKVIDYVADHPDITLRYIGAGTCEQALAAHCAAKNIHNVAFSGRFTPEEKVAFYEETDFVLSCYGNDTPVVRTALPNRLYESCQVRRPIIVNSGTFLAKLVERYGIGIVVDLDNLETLHAQMLAYTCPDHYQAYVKNCVSFMAMVSADIAGFESRVNDFFNGGSVAISDES